MKEEHKAAADRNKAVHKGKRRLKPLPVT